MTHREIRHTFSAVAWVATVLCSLALLASATGVAGAPNPTPDAAEAAQND